MHRSWPVNLAFLFTVTMSWSCSSSSSTSDSSGAGATDTAGAAPASSGGSSAGATSSSGAEPGGSGGGLLGAGGAAAGADAFGGISAIGGGGAGIAGTASSGGANGTWKGLQVSGTGFVDAQGKEFIPRGLGVGEWRNLENYMLAVDSPDVGGLGPSKLRALLVKAMGQANADAFFTTWEKNLITADDVAKWASWGVNSVRLPINYRSISSADGAYIEQGFAAIDQFIAWCKAQNIVVVLDLHAAPGSQNCEVMSDSQDGVAGLWKHPELYRQWTIDLWQTIAARYANESAVGGYDLFDEPFDVKDDASFSEGDAALRKMYLDLTSAIRTVDPHHVIFVEGTNWSQDPGFDGLTPAWDPQLAWAFHKYWDENNQASIQGYLDLRTKTNRPVWNGETGENTDSWNQAMIALLEANKIGWNMWTYKKVECGGSCEAGNMTDPYSIQAPANYAKMSSYLAGKGSAPAAADATKIMMALADNAATSKCTYSASYVKAVFGK